MRKSRQVTGTDHPYSHMTMFPNTPPARGRGRHVFRGDEGDKVRRMELFFYDYGTIFYDDIFAGRHWTHFCYRYDLDRTPVEFTPCSTYNDTDDYPQKPK